MKTEKINFEIKANCKPLLNGLKEVNKEMQKLIYPTKNRFYINNFVIGIFVGIGISCIGIIIFYLLNLK